jgi:hypothetical protein
MKFIERNVADFHPEKQHVFNHNLSHHPLLQLDEIRKLAQRHPTIRYHSAKVARSQRLDLAVQECPNGHTLEETLRNIDTTGSFVFIMDVQKDPIYRNMVDEIMDEVEGSVHRFHKNMRKRQAWIFVTSPGGTTPYHRDHESSHYFHIKGKKTLWLWDHNDKEVISQEENEHLHGVHGLKKTVYKEALMEKATEHHLSPGQGVFFPYTAPHMVENGADEYSISFSVTHMTDETYNIKRIHKINQLLRKTGIKPKDVNDSYLSDRMKLGLHWMLRNSIYSFNKDWKDA